MRTLMKMQQKVSRLAHLACRRCQQHICRHFNATRNWLLRPCTESGTCAQVLYRAARCAKHNTWGKCERSCSYMMWLTTQQYRRRSIVCYCIIPVQMACDDAISHARLTVVEGTWMPWHAGQQRNQAAHVEEQVLQMTV